jgi:hemin uptake protein HemP
MKNDEKTMIQQKLISFLAQAPFSTLPVKTPPKDQKPSESRIGGSLGDLSASPQIGSKTAGSPKRNWLSDEILSGQKEVVIQHGDATYRLTHTKTGKLILHK